MLSGVDDPDTIQRALTRGASAFVSSTSTRATSPRPSGRRPRRPSSTRSGPPRNGAGTAAKDAGLSERELEILKALARGLSNKQIAKEGWVTEQTVKFHLSNIYRKLGVANRTEATRFAYQHGLVDSPLYDAS